MGKSKSKSQKNSARKNSSQKDEAALSPKEEAALKRKKAQERKDLIQFTGSIFGFSIVFGGLLSFALGDGKIGLGLIFGIPCFAFSYKYPRYGLWAFWVYLPFSGTITYWVAGGNALFQLAKDAFYIPALFGLLQQCKRKRLPIIVFKGLMPSLYILLAFLMLTLFTVNGALQLSGEASGKPFLQGILGLKVMLGYFPLVFCAYYLIQNKKDLVFLGRLTLLLAIACCLLGFVQYWMLDSGRCVGTRGLAGDDLFKATLGAKCLVGGSLVFSPEVDMVRLPGTFVSPWHWAWFLISNSALTFTTAFNDPSILWRVGGLAGMALVFMNAVISGQRIALVLVPFVTVVLLVLTGQVANLKRFLPIGVGLAVVLVGVSASNPAVVQERWQSTVSRWEASPPTAFITQQFQWALVKTTGDPLGDGLGLATNSTRAFGHVELVETFHPKVMFETGPFGLAAFMLFVTVLTILTFKAYRSVRDRNLRSYGASFWVFVLIISYWPYWYPLDTDPVGVYYWFLAGVILKLPELDKQEQLLKAEREEAENQEGKDKNKKGKRKQSKSKKGKKQRLRKASSYP